MRASFLVTQARSILRHPVITFIVRAFVLLSMSFAAAFGFLAAMRSPGAQLRSLHVRDRRGGAVRRGLRRDRACCSRATRRSRRSCGSCASASRICPTATGSSRRRRSARRSLLTAQGDVIVRRDSDGRISYVNDAFCTLAGRTPRANWSAPTFALAGARTGRNRSCSPTARASTIRRSPPPTARAGSPGARCLCAPGGAGAEVQSVGRDVTDRVEAERALAERARPGGGGQPRQVALPRHGVARDPHAAQRHPRHGRTSCSTPR